MITINNLSKVYETKKVLSIENLDFQKGQTIGLVGNNGAGKTTLFSLILDLIEPSSGFVSIDGEKVNESENWKNKVGAFIDETFLIGYLTPEEYFYFLGELRGQIKANVDEFLKNFTDFFNGEILNAKKYIRDLSKGNMKKGYAFAGSNAFLADKISSVKEVMNTLEREFFLATHKLV